ncbi:MAG TPA: type 4a pilus biogenesis protein PilO [archaeon]|nr:type 4a pilus biogenesis protein PilO [archaeon]
MALDTSNPKFQKAALVIILVLGASYGYFSYIYGPKKESLETLKAEFAKIESSLKTARLVVESADTMLLIQELEKRERQLAMAEALLPDKENLPELLESITSIGNQTGVKFVLFEPKTPIQHELYQERPYSVTLRGGYHQTAMFLSDVASLPQIVKPVGLSMVRDTRAGAEPGETLTAKLALSTFLMIENQKEIKKEVKGK